VGIGAVVGLLVIAAIVFAMRTPTTTTNAPTQTTEMSDLDASLLKQAKELAEAKDFEAAHGKLAALSETSPARDTQEFKDIEGKWADFMFSKADHETDVADKRRALQQITSTSSVDAERRKRAADMLHQLGGTEPTANPAPHPGGGGPYVPPNPGGGTGAAPAGGGAAGGATATPSKTSEPGPTGNLPPQPGTIDEAAIRKGIEGKVWSGKASVDEIKMLIAICRHQKDMACKDRAAQMLKQKQSAP
jgi:hypothetical protein